MKSDLKNILQALLFSTSEVLELKDFQRVFNLYSEQMASEEVAEETGEPFPALESFGKKELQAALDELKLELEESEDLHRIIQEGGGYRMVLAPQYAHWIRLLRNDTRPLKLSNAALETLALIAYRQPATRAEMEMVRGVSVDSAIGKLLEHDLIHVSGQANLPGRPRLYATTDKFLAFCGINSLEELPASDVLSPDQISEWVKEANKRERVTEQELGLPMDGEPEPEEPLEDQ